MSNGFHSMQTPIYIHVLDKMFQWCPIQTQISTFWGKVFVRKKLALLQSVSLMWYSTYDTLWAVTYYEFLHNKLNNLCTLAFRDSFGFFSPISFTHVHRHCPVCSPINSVIFNLRAQLYYKFSFMDICFHMFSTCIW